ncbi:MAG TPA: CehA/McbA family metallohydrolase [Candidatus Eremiobacteraceae bacterium]|nr:CehA/McbA family metallohydrolase [Candidatus Eremiobacteraceae bacterium]
MRRASVAVCAVLSWLAGPACGQRRPVLPQIDEPHPYYYRELYLPQLTSGPSSLTWSPDSQELLYSMGGSLWRQKVNAKEAQQLTDGPGYDYQPDWSPDGKSVVYVSYQKDAMELWVLDVASGRSTQLTTGGAVNVEPRWSPDGKKIVWVSTRYHKRFHVFIAEVEAGRLKNATRLTGETRSPLPRYYYSAYDMEINPVWTRDGKEILFVSNRGHIYGTGGFWRMKAQPGAEAQEIHYEETSWKARPDFSPDGSRMVYSSYIGREWQNLWVLPANGGDAFPISYGSWDQSNARWSPDGTKIAYISNFTGSTAIEVQQVPSGGIEQITDFDPRNLNFRKPIGMVQLSIDDENGQPTSARVSMTDEAGRFCWQESTVHADDGFDRSDREFERHYVYVNASDEFVVPVGRATLEVSKGLSYRFEKRTIEIGAGESKEIHITMQRLPTPWNPTENWSSADLHVHMNYGGTYQNDPEWLHVIADAEDVRFVHNLTVNKEQRLPDIEFVDFNENSGEDSGSSIIQGQEFHTSYWGHRGVLHLKDHLLLPGYAGYPNTAAASSYPMNADVYDMAHEQGALVGAVHPFDEVPDPFAKPAQEITDELPVDAALGKLDYVEIVGFSDHKSTATVWYKLLNLGFKLPAGGGTDATTNYAAPIRGQAGFDRVYVWTPEWPASAESWLNQLKQGRSFATNGPLIGFTLGGQMAGSELKFESAQEAIPFTAKLRSIVPVDHLEVVCNGKVAQDLKLDASRASAEASGTIPLKESGWCVLRAWSEKAEYPVMDNYAYATTSPVYVTIGGKRAYAKEDAEYFEAWIDRTIEVTDGYPDWNSPEEKQRVMKKLQEARAVYEGMK